MEMARGVMDTRGASGPEWVCLARSHRIKYAGLASTTTEPAGPLYVYCNIVQNSRPSDFEELEVTLPELNKLTRSRIKPNHETCPESRGVVDPQFSNLDVNGTGTAGLVS